MALDPQKALLLLRELGVGQADLDSLRRLPLAEARTKLAGIKEAVNRQFRRFALELHPDRTGNDPTKAQKFKDLSQVRDDFLKLELQAAPPPPPVVVLRPVPFRGVVISPASGAVNAAQSATAVVDMGRGFGVRVNVRRVF